jgi:hypothetical protein
LSRPDLSCFPVEENTHGFGPVAIRRFVSFLALVGLESVGDQTLEGKASVGGQLEEERAPMVASFGDLLFAGEDEAPPRQA